MLSPHDHGVVQRVSVGLRESVLQRSTYFFAERLETKDSERLRVSQTAQAERPRRTNVSIIMKILFSFRCSFTSYYFFDIHKYFQAP